MLITVLINVTVIYPNLHTFPWIILPAIVKRLYIDASTIICHYNLLIC